MRPGALGPLYLLTLQVLACAKIAHNLDILVEHADEVVQLPLCYPDSDDSSCSAYQDCCASDRHANPVLADSITCETVKLCTNGTCSRLQGQYSVHMVSKCPPSQQNSLLRTQCQSQGAVKGSVISDKMSLPVYSNRTGLLYKNAYCAMCHAETKNDESLQLAASALACNGSSTCSPVAIVKSQWTHICYPGLVSTCQGSAAEDPMLLKACEQGPASYEVCDGSAYRNKYCRLCRIGWYAPKCRDSSFPLWQLRSSLDSGGLMGVFVSFRPLRDNLPVGGFGTWGSNSTTEPLSAVLLALYGTHAASIVGLTVLLGIYIGLPALRNRPGFCLCSHAACVLVLEILTVAARLLQPTHVPCLCILLASHFCLTGAFTWAAAFGVDLLRCLVSSLPTGVIAGSAKPLLALWLVPATLAGILGGLNSRLGLWDLAVCQFAPCQKWVMLAVSVTPLSAALIFNFSLALAVHIVLRRRRREASRVMAKSAAAAAAARQVGATLRVSVAMGAAWLPIFCLGNLPSSVGGDAKLLAVAVSAGELVAALHGLVLAICFCCGRRVRQKLAARFA